MLPLAEMTSCRLNYNGMRIVLHLKAQKKSDDENKKICEQ